MQVFKILWSGSTWVLSTNFILYWSILMQKSQTKKYSCGSLAPPPGYYGYQLGLKRTDYLQPTYENLSSIGIIQVCVRYS